MTAASPGIISTTMLNAFYDSHDSYLDAIAREMSKEYQAVHKAGLVLQIDAPDLAMDRTMMYRDLSDSDFVKRCERHVAAINKGIEGIPRDRVRLHVCYGNWEGPHIHDIPLEKILPALYTANVGALSIEFSNPRHAHEYTALKKHPLPKHMILIPGVVETTSNFVEHPEVVARSDRRSGVGGRRPRTCHRLDRLRFRHLHQARVGDRAGGLAEAQGDPPRRGSRFAAVVGEEGGVTGGWLGCGLDAALGRGRLIGLDEVQVHLFQAQIPLTSLVVMGLLRERGATRGLFLEALRSRH